MLPLLKSEFRKLLTVRSTYITTIVVTLFVALISIWPEGLTLPAGELRNPMQLSGDITGPMTVVGIFAGVVAILLMSHEYRYNVIVYSLTASNSRLKTLAAKFVVVSCYGLFFAAFISAVAPLCSLLGIHLAGHTLVPQTIDYVSLIWRCLFVGWGMASAGLVLAVLIRNQIGAIVTMVVYPLVIESATIPLLKDNVNYLPFHALFSVTQPSAHLTAGRAAVYFLSYFVGFGIFSAILFLRRDAN